MGRFMTAKPSLWGGFAEKSSFNQDPRSGCDTSTSKSSKHGFSKKSSSGSSVMERFMSAKSSYSGTRSFGQDRRSGSATSMCKSSKYGFSKKSPSSHQLSSKSYMDVALPSLSACSGSSSSSSSCWDFAERERKRKLRRKSKNASNRKAASSSTKRQGRRACSSAHQGMVGGRGYGK